MPIGTTDELRPCINFFNELKHQSIESSQVHICTCFGHTIDLIVWYMLLIGSVAKACDAIPPLQASNIYDGVGRPLRYFSSNECLNLK